VFALSVVKHFDVVKDFVVNHTGFRPALRNRHIQSIAGQDSIGFVRHRPTNNLARIHSQHSGHMQPVLSCWDKGNVDSPYRITPLSVKWLGD
jgi:hypothetical protein